MLDANDLECLEPVYFNIHKHKTSHPYYQHDRANTLRKAVRGIRRHDRGQMQVRPSKS